MDFSEPLQINRDMYAPIEGYRDLLNYVSRTYGTPLSPRVVKEYQTISALEKAYANILEGLTSVISEGKVAVSPNSRKYNFMEFQIEYMGVPKSLTLNKGSISADSNSRERVDVECPNFINSLFDLWGDLSSRSRLKNIACSVEFVDGVTNSWGEPLVIVRPNYTIKDTTLRITTDDPNLQGLSTLYKKEFLVSEQGRKLVGADISSQEPSIFFNGMCYDEDVIRGFIQVGEIYKPVVAKIEGIPMDMVDSSLRKAYKVGILSKMNNAGISLLAAEMGSMELAEKLNKFVVTNPTYSQFLQKVERQLLTPEPTMEGFIKGRSRTIKETGYKGRNQLINAPLQITGISFMSISIFAFIERMMKDYGDWNSFEEFLFDVRPVYHAHDEVVWSVIDKKDYVEYAKKCLSWALSVKYENWVPFRAEAYADIKYHH